jgi:hypothetical protein
MADLATAHDWLEVAYPTLWGCRYYHSQFSPVFQGAFWVFWREFLVSFSSRLASAGSIQLEALLIKHTGGMEGVAPWAWNSRFFHIYSRLQYLLCLFMVNGYYCMPETGGLLVDGVEEAQGWLQTEALDKVQVDCNGGGSSIAEDCCGMTLVHWNGKFMWAGEEQGTRL